MFVIQRTGAINTRALDYGMGDKWGRATNQERLRHARLGTAADLYTHFLAIEPFPKIKKPRNGAVIMERMTGFEPATFSLGS